jgi:hypothetical protein
MVAWRKANNWNEKKNNDEKEKANQRIRRLKKVKGGGKVMTKKSGEMWWKEVEKPTDQAKEQDCADESVREADLEQSARRNRS